MDNKIKIDFKNKIIEVEGDSEFINDKLDWFVNYNKNISSFDTNDEVVENFQEKQLYSGENDAVSIFGVPFEKLNYIVHIKDKDFKFILQSKKLKGGKAESQVHLALIYCGVCELLKIEPNTKELRKICDDYKCLDGNFAPNLKRDGYFSIEKGINSEITLTMPGRDALQDYIKQLLDTQGKEE